MKIRRFNLVVLVLLFVFLFFYYVLWQFISSPFFAGIATRLVNESIPEEYQDSIKFKKLRVGNFPPRIIIEDITLQLENIHGFKNVLVEAGELHAGINIFSSYRDKLSLSYIKLNNGFVFTEKIEIKEKESESIIEKKKKERKKIKNEINQFVSNNLKGFDLGAIIISRFELEDMLIQGGKEYSAFVKRSSIEAYRDKIHTDIDVEDIRVDLEDLKSLSSVNLKGVLDKKSYQIDYLKISKGSSLLSLRGEIKNPFDKLKRNFIIKFSGELVPNEISNSGITKELELKGVVKFQGESIGRRKVEKISTVLVFKNFESKYLVMNKGVGNLSFENGKVVLNKMKLEIDEGEGKLISKATIYDFNKKELLNDPIKISITNIPIDKAIIAVPEVSKKLTGIGSGIISLLINKKKVLVTNESKIDIKDLSLKNKSKELLKIKQINLEKSKFDFDLKTKILLIDSVASFSEKKIIINGSLSERKIDIKTNDFYINLKSFYHLADFEVEGYGKLNILAKGSLAEPVLEYSFDLDKSQMAGFYLGKATGSITMKLEDKVITLNKLEGEIGTGRYSVKGNMDFESNKMDIRGRFKNFNIENLRKSHGPVLKEIEEHYWNFVSGVLSGEYHFEGGLGLEDMIVSGTYYSDDLTIFKERINSFRANMNFKNMNLTLSDVNLDIGNGAIIGDFSYNMPNQVSRFSFESEKLSTKDLTYYLSHGLGYSSSINLKFNGINGKISKKLNVEALFYDSVMSGLPVDNSSLNFQMNEKNINIKANFLENMAVFNSQVDLADKSKIKNGDFDFDLRIPHWSYVLNLISSYDLKDSYLEGSLVANLKGTFDFNDWENLDLKGEIEHFSFDHPQIDVSSSGKNIVEIANGVINRWIFKIVGSDNEEFISHGSGSLKNDFDINFQSRFILDKINRVLGSLINLKGNMELIGNIKKSINEPLPKYDLKIKGNDVSVSRIGWYTSLDNTTFELDLEDDQLKIEKFKSNLGNGDLEISGMINNFGFNPDLNIKYDFNDAVISINERSFLVINGEGGIIGSTFPYAVSGDMRVVGGEVFDEFEKFTSDNSSFSLKNTNKYTPKARENIGSDLASLNLNATIEKEIWFRNSLVDFKILGGLNITGTNKRPLLFGKIYTNLDKENKVVVKNNELFVEKMIINFGGNEDYTNPLVDFSSNMKTNDYKVFVQAYGPAKNLTIDFSSDPYLDRQSILSLMAFGYAEQYSDRLSESDRESISSAGVGSFLFNKLKINETLKDNLGITLNVDTEFEQDEQSFLQGRTQSGGRGNSVRSSTKVEMNKKITENVDISLSSSISGSIGQKQKMNLNYTINKNLRLEGVYELTTDDNSEEGGSDKSVGADVKFRWTFK